MEVQEAQCSWACVQSQWHRLSACPTFRGLGACAQHSGHWVIGTHSETLMRRMLLSLSGSVPCSSQGCFRTSVYSCGEGVADQEHRPRTGKPALPLPECLLEKQCPGWHLSGGPAKCLWSLVPDFPGLNVVLFAY